MGSWWMCSTTTTTTEAPKSSIRQSSFQKEAEHLIGEPFPTSQRWYVGWTRDWQWGQRKQNCRCWRCSANGNARIRQLRGIRRRNDGIMMGVGIPAVNIHTPGRVAYSVDYGEWFVDQNTFRFIQKGWRLVNTIPYIELCTRIGRRYREESLPTGGSNTWTPITMCLCVCAFLIQIPPEGWSVCASGL